MNDLDDVTLHDGVLRVARTRHDRPIDLDRHRAFRQPKVLDEAPDGQAIRHEAPCSVDGDLHGEPG